ncbi:2'-deoxymugineic-acid 2'-dioxygenase-like [Ananas comosus]|uniref:2'-deoxymugineic-acid 2'-dioxygenase-like n=1 Tax=Ananas comosus TaxID=4615 RepID=A0A6P5HM88_ANACO|nr:2'-deoxymugineic-acid 2'-dioxygenase-like [Ananas comosus]
MELLSSGVALQTVPEKYIFPAHKRPAKELVDSSVALPVIDLRGGRLQGDGRDEIVREIVDAGKQFGFFQVVNHGVPEQLIEHMVGVSEELFNMPVEEKAKYYSDDPSIICRLGSSTPYDQNGIRYWRDYLKLVCYPVEEFMHLWPQKPDKFREVLAKYIVEVRELADKLLRLIAEGLGLEQDYFSGGFSGGQTQMNVNYYPPCPDPSLTLGLLPHCDRHLITLLVQGTAARGLQAKFEGKWIPVEPIRNAFVVNFGHQLEIITNGVLRSVEHRAVTNTSVARLSIASLIMPKTDCLIAPAKSLINEHNPPKYKSFTFEEFLSAYNAAAANREGVLEYFKIEE